MRSRLQLFYLDCRRAWLTLLISAFAVIAVTGYVINEVEKGQQVWRMGYLALEIFVPLFLLWPMLFMQRFFDSDETESLRTAGFRYSSVPSLVFLYLLEAALFIIPILWGRSSGLVFIHVLFRAWIINVFLSSVFVFLTVILRNQAVPLALVFAYCFFCTLYGSQAALKKYCLYYPADSAPVDQAAVVAKLWLLGAAGVLLTSAYLIEKKRAWLE